uniref:helix-turn-helix transcriptional regulator n=1 Tax=Roseburia hominis TaxID=301301 RepID=UPI0034A593FD
ALDDLFNDMDALHDAATPGYELLLKADFLRLVALLLPCCSAADEDTRLHMEYTAKLKTVLEYIDAHYTEELSIADLASLCYFSEYHFMRFFKRFMGTSCLNYIKNLRLEKAAELLGQDGLPPLDASLSAGFHNLSYFYREFRKKYGVTPGDFRGAGAREK